MNLQKNNIYTSIARFFVTNKEFSLVTLLTIFALGLFSFISMPKQYNPEITLPAFRIVTDWSGATIEEMEQLVTNEIENKLYEILGVDETSSQTFAGGKSVVTVMFKIGNDLEISKTKVYEKMQGNMNFAPLGVSMPLIQQINPENVAILTFAITGENYTAEGLREFAFDLREELKTVENVTNVEVLGGKKKQLNVLLDANQLTARGISVNDVLNVIQSNNLRLPIGYIEGQKNIPIEVDGNITSQEQLARLVVGQNGESKIYLSDIAIIENGYELLDSYVRFRTKDNGDFSSNNAVYLSLAKQKGKNSVTVAESIHSKLEELKDSFIPQNIAITTVRDEGKTASEAIGGLMQNLLTAIVIVTILIMFFLHGRAAFVVALAIPLTFALVLFVGYLFGETINRITLFALILSLGLLVDSATVVVENIYRHISKGTEGRTQAVVNAVGEVGSGLLLSTITSVIVFIPMSFISGMMGAYMGPIAFFVPAALLASLFVAYTLSPFLASYFFKENKTDTVKKEAKAEQKTTKVDVWYRNFIYSILNSRKKQNWILSITAILLLITFTFPVFELIHFRMLPKADKEQFYIYLDLPENAGFEETNKLTEKIEQFILQEKEVISVQSYVGINAVTDFNGLFKGSDMRQLPNQATLKINLTHPDDRSEESEKIVIRLRPEIQKLFINEPDVRLKLLEDPPGPPVFATLLARIKGPDQDVREMIARDLVQMYRETEGVVDIDTTLPIGVSQKVLKIDHEKVAHSGINTNDVITTLRTALSGEIAGISHLNTREQNHIYVRLQKNDRNELNDLSQIFLKNKTGEMIALQSLIKEVDEPYSIPIWHDERKTTTLVSAELSDRAVVYAVKDLILKLRDYQLPNGGELENWSLFGFNFLDQNSGEIYRIEWGGEFEMTLENFRDLGLAMFVAFFLVYIILVAQFRSFRTPLLVMSSIILAFGGVMPGFAILDFFGIYFTATSMIGLIALGGIVVNNAIILLEFLQQLKERGLPAKAAIIEACQTRLRPIILTSLTTILGSLTIVNDPVWSGLAWAIIFGLSLSTILTLVIFPVLYYRFEE